MKNIAASLATTSDLLLNEKDKVNSMQKETLVLQRKCVAMDEQIKQEVSDKEIILHRLDKLTIQQKKKGIQPKPSPEPQR